jgi:hypothetical protein
LASVLIVDSKFSAFEDIWRCKEDLRIEVLIDRYVRFLLSEVDLYRYFTAKDVYALRAYQDTESPEALKKIYPFYTRDVVIAQAIEVLRADSAGLRPTEIVYTSPESEAKQFRVCSIPPKYIEHGRSLLAQELASRGIPKPLNVSEPCQARMRYCFATYELSERAIKNNAISSWNMDV